jgi:hypothetical protein
VSAPEGYTGRGGADTEDDAEYMRGDSPFLCLRVHGLAVEQCRRVDIPERVSDSGLPAPWGMRAPGRLPVVHAPGALPGGYIGKPSGVQVSRHTLPEPGCCRAGWRLST